MEIIRPELKNILRASIIIASLLAILPVFKVLVLEAIAVFMLSFAFIVLFCYSYKIVLNNSYLIFYQLFLPLGRIKLSDIKAIRYVALAKSGQRCALEITLMNKKIKAYPIRLFNEIELNDLILYVRKQNNLNLK